MFLSGQIQKVAPNFPSPCPQLWISSSAISSIGERTGFPEAGKPRAVADPTGRNAFVSTTSKSPLTLLRRRRGGLAGRPGYAVDGRLRGRACVHAGAWALRPLPGGWAAHGAVAGPREAQRGGGSRDGRRGSWRWWSLLGQQQFTLRVSTQQR